MLLGMGTLYSYSTYSPVLKVRLNYSETETNAVSAVGGLGAYIGAIPVGLFYDRFGPRWTFLGAGSLIFIGYFSMFAALQGWIMQNAFFVGIYFWLAILGSIGTFEAVLATNTKNFKSQLRGKVVGMTLGAFGLSAAAVTQAFKFFFAENENIDGFLLFLSIVLASLSFLGMLAVRHLPPEENKPQKMVRTKLDSDSEDEMLEADELLFEYDDEATGLEDENANLGQINRPKFGDLTGLSLIKEPQFFVLWITVFFIGGAGLSFLNVLGGVVKSWEITTLNRSTYVIISSLANFCGRLVFGSCVDFVRTRSIPTIILLIPVALIMAVFQLMMAFITNWFLLVVATFGITFAYGGMFAVYIYCINSYFGDKHYAQNVGWLGVAVGSGGFLLSFIAGRLYDNNVPVENQATHQCFGQVCYMYSFIITAVCCLFPIAMVVFLSKREREKDQYRQKLEVYSFTRAFSTSSNTSDFY